MSYNSIYISEYPNKPRTLCTNTNLSSDTSAKYNPVCFVCTKKNSNVKTSIPCPSCKHLIHKKCSQLAPNDVSNLRECPTCTENKFPLSVADDAEVYLDSFNSNWTCNCKSRKPVKVDCSDYKLILTQKDPDDANFYSPDGNFDEQYEICHSLNLILSIMKHMTSIS